MADVTFPGAIDRSPPEPLRFGSSPFASDPVECLRSESMSFGSVALGEDCAVCICSEEIHGSDDACSHMATAWSAL